jgi:hypothetical protein
MVFFLAASHGDDLLVGCRVARDLHLNWQAFKDGTQDQALVTVVMPKQHQALFRAN